ncbi:MAG: imidazole glycerol phosphate synthase subunit HisH [Candidatus Omnitrophica bacterium]|nr:imidazole glycerol phosphate synthase subunit HisH [Candidatus Omnitrophota bacterium]
MIAIIDYGMGNIHSVQKALQLFGAKTVVTNKPDQINACDKIVLPGVGAFNDAMRELQRQKLDMVIQKSVESKKPFLGICLGMQLLFEQSQEAPACAGLGILKGIVNRFENNSLKVPHMGWNTIRQASADCPLLAGIAQDAYVYFCHSYFPVPVDKKVIAARCTYGEEFSAIVWQGNVFGTQFHPEKSQAVGLAMLKNFVVAC